MTLHIPLELGAELASKAQSLGVSPDVYLRQILERELGTRPVAAPLRSSYGVLAQYGAAPSDQEIRQNRREMFQRLASGGEVENGETAAVSRHGAPVVDTLQTRKRESKPKLGTVKGIKINDPDWWKPND